MKALILAGGFGMRLMPLTRHTAKPLLPVLNKPVIFYIIEDLARAKITDITISINKTLAPQLNAALGDGKKLGVKIKYVVEPAESEAVKLGGVGAINYAKSHLEKTSYLVLGADNFSPGFDFAKFIAAHKKSRCTASVALYRVPDKKAISQYGVAVLNKKGRVVGFQEKPEPGEAKSDLAGTCFYAVEPDFIFKYVPELVEAKLKAGERPDNLGEIFESMISKGAAVNGYVFCGFWTDIGRLEGYLKGHRFLMGKLGTKIVIDESAKVDKTAEIKGPVLIDADVVVEKNASILPFTHLMKGSRVGDDSSVSSSIVMVDSTVGRNCALEECIVAAGGTVADGSVVVSRILGEPE